MVDVNVEDGDAAHPGVAVDVHGVGGADGGVVEQAEAVAAWWEGKSGCAGVGRWAVGTEAESAAS